MLVESLRELSTAELLREYEASVRTLEECVTAMHEAESECSARRAEVERRLTEAAQPSLPLRPRRERKPRKPKGEGAPPPPPPPEREPPERELPGDEP